jgi:hypothetical protein
MKILETNKSDIGRGFFEMEIKVELNGKHYWPMPTLDTNTEKYSIIFDRDYYEFENLDDAIYFSIGGFILDEVDGCMNGSLMREPNTQFRASRLDFALEEIDELLNKGLVNEAQKNKLVEGAAEFENVIEGL